MRELLTTSHDLGSPAWSPDGGRIAYVSDEAGSYDIWTVRSDGSDPRRVTNAADFQDSNPQWSPDGKTIALRRQLSPDPSLVMFVSDTGGEPRAVQFPRYISDLAW